MKITEMLLDKIIDSTLFEMASSRKDAKRLITGLSPQIFGHLIKLFVFNSINNRSGWIKEINSWLNDIDDIYLKPSNKKPDWQTIYNWMIFDSAPHYTALYIDNKVKKLIATTFSDASVHDYDPETVLNHILKILEQVTKDIADDKFITLENYLK